MEGLMVDNVGKTKYYDKNGLPVHIGDLIKVPHFVAARKRKIFMYKKVFLVNDKVYAVGMRKLGFVPADECHKCFLEDCEDFEIIDGDSFDHPLNGSLVCWWERKKSRPDREEATAQDSDGLLGQGGVA